MFLRYLAAIVCVSGKRWHSVDFGKINKNLSLCTVLGAKIILLLQASHLVLDVSSNPKQGWVVTACCPVKHSKCNLT